jgi:hypothetical protein
LQGSGAREPIGASAGCQRLEALGHRDDAGPERDLLAGQAVRLACAIPALVVAADSRRHLGRELCTMEDLLAGLGMARNLETLAR